jgi:hypothetical protein
VNQIAIQLPWHHFGGTTYWSGPKKKRTNSKESSRFGEPKCKLGSKVANFYFYFFNFTFLPLLLKLCENEKHSVD